MPSFKGTVLQHVQKAKDFITRAGTIILLMSVIIWLLQNFTPTLLSRRMRVRASSV